MYQNTNLKLAISLISTVSVTYLHKVEASFGKSYTGEVGEIHYTEKSGNIESDWESEQPGVPLCLQISAFYIDVLQYLV